VTTVSYQDWSAEVERDANIAAYANIQASGSDACGCQDCRNFVALRDSGMLYPPDVLALLDSLGVDPNLEAESWSVGPVIEGHPDLHFYSWWFNVIGTMCAGELTASREVDVDLHVYPVEGGALADPGFGEATLFRLEFYAGLPWVLDEVSWESEWERDRGR
jgi:hypothetical protein